MADPVVPPTLSDMLGSFGPIETQSLTRIELYTAKAMTRSWTVIPHVTHNDLLSIKDVEIARKAFNSSHKNQRLSLLPFMLKAVASTLIKFPRFGAAIDEPNKQLVYRKYVNLGVAVDTPAGLFVPVVRNCNEKTVSQIAGEVIALAERAKTTGLSLSEMSGGCFTISSLGALGGTGFTPIINAPEVAILGIGRTAEHPARATDGAIEWVPVVPVSLSYDHRVINGADAGRFLATLQDRLNEIAETEIA